MSDTEDRKSMDDVLASIRRIVRSEKDPEQAEIMPEQEPTPMAGDVSQEPTADIPLALTPEMLMEGEEEDGDDVTDAETVSESGPSETPVVAPPVGGLPSVDPDQIKQMVRDVVMEQLGGEDAGKLVRGIIRDELVNGEVGMNISHNVLALIQAEISKAK